ncbi:MAG: hypothetical protein ACK4F4_01680 [Hylemonella sp.]|jgi:hypothetical protein|uniref:hypothetical protein n=1 Tax=Hylemonella sp. TaxID=2066020 RepID=UPI00391B0092
MPQQIIHIQPAAPEKPAVGQPCNGCGVCCLAEPCPLGQLLSRRRRGACDALRWDAASSRYRCGALREPDAVLRTALASWPGRWMRPWLLPLLRWQAGRWIAAGQGCDCTLEIEASARSDGQSGP